MIQEAYINFKFPPRPVEKFGVILMFKPHPLNPNQSKIPKDKQRKLKAKEKAKRKEAKRAKKMGLL